MRALIMLILALSQQQDLATFVRTEIQWRTDKRYRQKDMNELLVKAETI